MGDSAEVEILLKWKEENAAAHAEVMRKLGEMTAAQTAANAATAQWYSPIQALIGALPVWVTLIAGAALVLAPFAAVALSSAVALVSFAAAGAGTLALLGGLALGFGAMGAAILLLGGGGGVGAAAALQTATTRLYDAQQALKDFNALNTGALNLSQQQQKEDLTLRQTRAQDAYNNALIASQGPTGVLLAQLGQMKDTLAAQAAPLAALITQWAEKGIPALTGFASALISWFGDRLPFVLKNISWLLNDLEPTFTGFGKFLGTIFDSNYGAFATVFDYAFKLAAAAATGLIANLSRLSFWFVNELPSLGPIVLQTLGGLGNIIQFVASTWAKFNDWIVANWGSTIAQAKQAWDNFSSAFKGVDWSGLSNSLIGIGQDVKGVGLAAATATGQVGNLITSLQQWANNNAFWSGLQTKLLALTVWINGVLTPIGQLLDRLGIDSGPRITESASGGYGGGGVGGPPGATSGASGQADKADKADNSTTSHNSTTIHIYGTDTNSAPAVAAAVTAAMRQRGFRPGGPGPEMTT